MGENKHIKELDDFSKKYIKDIDTEKLSPEFTSELMKKIQVLNVYKVQPFTPLISKKVWFLIGLLLVAILSIPFNSNEESILSVPELDVTFLNKFQLSNLIESVSISNTTFSIICLFGLMIFIQFIYLKKYFESRIH
ncbi:hypothetical protein [Polaribacter marinivivus]|uniref:Uncharacterized protein n=1 Tax=Polaribacter marinivivus TaxID=1524260 RepID=A0ABV8R893_9FLAO